MPIDTPFRPLRDVVAGDRQFSECFERGCGNVLSFVELHDVLQHYTLSSQKWKECAVFKQPGRWSARFISRVLPTLRVVDTSIGKLLCVPAKDPTPSESASDCCDDISAPSSSASGLYSVLTKEVANMRRHLELPSGLLCVLPKEEVVHVIVACLDIGTRCVINSAKVSAPAASASATAIDDATREGVSDTELADSLSAQVSAPTASASAKATGATVSTGSAVSADSAQVDSGTEVSASSRSLAPTHSPSVKSTKVHFQAYSSSAADFAVELVSCSPHLQA
jgi:hypothetical protein